MLLCKYEHHSLQILELVISVYVRIRLITIGEVRNQSLDYLPHIYDTIAFTSPLEGVKL